MNVRFMDNPFGQMDTDYFSETDIDALIFTRYRGGRKDLCPVSMVRFIRYYADGNEAMELDISEKSVNGMFPALMCNLAELSVSLYSALRNPKNVRILREYQTHLSSLKTALHYAYADKALPEQYVWKYMDIYKTRYGYNLVLMADIFLRYAELVQPWVVSTDQKRVSAYEQAREEGKRKGDV